MLSLKPIALADLLLSRLLLAGTDGFTKGELKRAVKAIAASQVSASIFSEQVSQTLADLETKGYVNAISPSRYQITDDGRQQVLNQLGLEKLTPKLQWQKLKDTYWIAYALKLPSLTTDTRKRIGKADGLRAAILQRAFELPIEDFSTLPKTRDALLWHQLSNPSTAERLQARLGELGQRKFDQSVLKEVLLNDLLQTSKAMHWEKALKQLVAKSAGAKRTDANALRLAILQRAFQNMPITAASDSHDVAEAAFPISSIPAPSDSAQLALPDFADRVLKAAKATQEGRSGDDKVFISKVWATLQEQKPVIVPDLVAFKQQLIAANRQQLLTLSRADLAYAFAPEDVKASETTYLNSTFHFIRID